MPFNVVKYKRGWRVMDDKGNFYSKKPLTKTMARQQQKALYASEARREHLSGSGYASFIDDEGNHHILLQGNGFFGDIWAKIKQVGNFVSKTLVPVITQPSLQTFSTAIGETVRLDYPPKARETLAKYGSGTVYQLMIVREPIQSFINQALNAITLGKWNEAKRKLNYDRLFHLSMVASLSMPNGDKATVKIEKNEVINITDDFALKQPGVSSGSASNVSQHGSGRDAEFMPVPVSCCITLAQMMTNARDAVGDSFFKYDAFYNNCQLFILSILRANNLLTPEVETFVNQNAEQLLQELPTYTRPFAGLITNIAGLANRIMYGEGEDELYGGCMECCGVCMEAVGNRLEGGKLYCGLKETPPGDVKGNRYRCFKKGVGVGMMLEQQKPKPLKPLEEMTIRELGQEASKLKIPGYGRMKKQELIDAIRPLRGGGDETVAPVDSKEAVRQYALNSLRGRGANDIDPITGFTPNQQRMIDRESTEEGKEQRRQTFRQYNQQFMKTVAVQPILAELHPDDITGSYDVYAPQGEDRFDNHSHIDQLQEEWKKSGKQDFKDYYYTDKVEFKDPETAPKSADGSPAIEAKKSRTGGWTLYYRDGTREILRSRNLNAFAPNVRNPLEAVQQLQGVSALNEQRLRQAEEERRAKMSGADRFFEGLNDGLTKIADVGSFFMPGVASTVYDTFRPQTSEERRESRIQQQQDKFNQASYEGMRTLAEEENQKLRGRLAPLMNYDETLKQRVGEEDTKGRKLDQFVSQLGEGKPANQPLPGFRKQLKQVGIKPEEYLKIVREMANEEGYDGRAVEFSDDPENKIMIYDDEGKKRYAGRVSYGDYILWSKQEALGKVRPGYAEMKRRVFNKSHSKIKGDWRSDKFSPNNLALRLLWSEKV